MEFLLLLQSRLEALTLLCEYVQQDRTILLSEKLESLDERGDVVPVDRAVVFQPQLLEYDAGPEHAFGDFFGLAGHAQSDLTAHLFDELPGALVQIVVLGARNDLIKIAGDGAYVLVNGPFVIVQDHQHALGVVGDVVQRLVGNAASESGISGHRDNVLFASGLVAGYSHSQCRRQRCPGVSRPVTVVRALGTEHETVQAARSRNPSLSVIRSLMNPRGEAFETKEIHGNDLRGFLKGWQRGEAFFREFSVYNGKDTQHIGGTIMSVKGYFDETDILTILSSIEFLKPEDSSQSKNHHENGLRFYKQGDILQTQAEFENAYFLSPENPDNVFMFAKSLLLNDPKDYDRVKNLLNKVLKLKLDHKDARKLLKEIEPKLSK